MRVLTLALIVIGPIVLGWYAMRFYWQWQRDRSWKQLQRDRDARIKREMIRRVEERRAYMKSVDEDAQEFSNSPRMRPPRDAA